jgi:predicted nucleotidyltransferase
MQFTCKWASGCRSADLTIPVASLAGIAVLKLFACHGRQTNDKDALDLYRVISS